MGIDTDGTMKHENIQTNEEVMRRGLGEQEHVGTVAMPPYAFEDYETPATDEEVAEIEELARKRGTMYWPQLVRTINRMRKAEARVAELEAGK